MLYFCTLYIFACYSKIVVNGQVEPEDIPRCFSKNFIHTLVLIFRIYV